MTTTKKPAKKAAPKTAPKAKAKTAPKGEAKQTAPKKSGACARVWAIADGMKDAPRKDVLARCIEAGLNKATASTQYQRWTHRGDAK